MRGIDIAREYYEAFGAPAIHEEFPALEGLIAVGLAGSGSECWGFDDELSRDHDFEPGFCLWIPEEDEIDSVTAFRLERMYAALPKEFMGLRRDSLATGGNRCGVTRYSRFLERHIGKSDVNFTLSDWFSVPECALSEVVNGQIWRDDSGRFTALRRAVKTMPEDVRLKKLAASLYLMGQSGGYNYARCIAHGERGAAQLSLAEFTKHAAHIAFLLSGEYMPYYKWSFRALRGLPVLSELAEKLEFLLNTGNEPDKIAEKQAVIDTCAVMVIGALEQHSLISPDCGDLGDCAFAVNERISDSYIRAADILAAAGGV